NKHSFHRWEMHLLDDHFGAGNGGEKNQRPVKEGEKQDSAQNSTDEKGDPCVLWRGVEKSHHQVAADKESRDSYRHFLENKGKRRHKKNKKERNHNSEPGGGVLQQIGSELNPHPKTNRRNEKPKKAPTEKENECTDDDTDNWKDRLGHRLTSSATSFDRV